MKIKFCSRCDTSIPHGLARVTHGKRLLCQKCGNRNTFLWRVWVITMLIGISLGLQYSRGESKTGDRGVEVRLSSRLYNMEMEFEAANKRLDDVADEINREIFRHTTILEIHQGLLSELYLQIKQVKKELLDRVASAKNLTHKVDQAIVSKIIELEQRLDDIKTDMASLEAIPTRGLYDKVLRPVVGIGVRDRKGGRDMGSGVLFYRVKLKKGYRYYGFTAYHVVHGVLDYIKYQQPKQPVAERKNPSFLIKVYNTVDRRGPTNAITTVKIEAPDEAFLDSFRTHFKKHKKPLGLKQSDDFAIFSFEYDADFALAEIATTEELENLRVGQGIIVAGIHPVKRPAAFTGIIASLHSANSQMAIQAMAWPGMSGAPVFDRKTLKVIAILQSGSFRHGSINSVVAYVQRLDKIHLEPMLRDPTK